MGLLIFFTIGLALWHFTVFLPDRFYGGIIGALVGSIVGAMFIGSVFQIARGVNISDGGVEALLVAAPGSLIGLVATYLIGIRSEST